LHRISSACPSQEETDPMDPKLSVFGKLGRVLVPAAALILGTGGMFTRADSDSSGHAIKPILPGVKFFSKSELAPKRALRPTHPPGLMPDRELAVVPRELSKERLGEWERFQKEVPGDWLVSWDVFTGGVDSIIAVGAGAGSGRSGPDLGPDVAAGAR